MGNKKDPTFIVVKRRYDRLFNQHVIVSLLSFDTRADARAYVDTRRSAVYNFVIHRCTPGPISRKKK